LEFDLIVSNRIANAVTLIEGNFLVSSEEILDRFADLKKENTHLLLYPNL
jgi:hypothetical protein